MSDLATERVVPLLRGRLGQPYDHRETCDSTQRLLLGSGLPEGATAVAEHQTAGRGRRGTTWVDAPGRTLLCSVLLRPEDGRGSAPLSLVAGLAVAEAVEPLAAVPTTVKWPNDVLCEGRKLAGMLLEQDGPELVCGIGVNVNQRREELPTDARIPPTSLYLLTGREHDRGLLLVDILARLEHWLAAFHSDGLEPVLQSIHPRDALLGRRVRAGGGVGVAAGINAEGALLVRTPDGHMRAVTSGEVKMLPASGDRDSRAVERGHERA